MRPLSILLALAGCLAAQAQTPLTGNLPAGVSATTVSNSSYAVGGGTAQAQTVNLSPAISAYSPGLSFCYTAAAANTATDPTLSVNGLAAVTILKLGTQHLALNDILAAPAVACVNYDGTNFQLLNPQSVTSNPLPVTVVCPGDGATDATSCIQTFVTNNDYIVFPEPATAYLTTAHITLHANMRIEGASPTTNTKGITNSSNTDDVFQCISTTACRNIAIKGMMFRDTAGARTSGAAIHIDGSGGASTLDIENNMVLGFQDGYWVAAMLNSLIFKNRSTNALRDAFHEDAATQTSTGTSFISNYGDHPARYCFSVAGMNYSGFFDNSCDSPSQDGYHLDASVTPIRGVVLIGNGSEQAVQNAMYIDGQEITIDGGALTTSSSGTGFSAIKLNGAINTKIGSGVYISGNWDYCINAARSPLHDTFVQQWTNTIEYPLPKCAGVTLGYLNDAGGITGGSITFIQPTAKAVKVVATSAISGTPTYSNTAGLPDGTFSTLTASGVGILTIDGYNTLLNDRILLAGQASAFQNGIWCVSTQGTAGAAYVLTRCPDFTIPGQMNFNGPIPVIKGTAYANTSWIQSSTVVTVGTTAVTFLPSLSPNGILEVGGTCTLAQINAGCTLLAGTTGYTLKAVRWNAITVGTFATCTLIELTDSSNVVISSAAPASWVGTQNESSVSSVATFAPVFTNTNLYTALTANGGLQVIKTGSNCTGGTSIQFSVEYKVNF